MIAWMNVINDCLDEWIMNDCLDEWIMNDCLEQMSGSLMIDWNK